MSEFQSSHSLQNSTLNYTIPKTKRFETPLPNSRGAFYNLPSMKSFRSAGIGYGMRKDCRAQQKSSPVSPNAYHVNQFYEMEQKKKKVSMRKRLSPLQDTSRNNPGPGTYNVIHSSFIKDNPIVVRSRLEYFYTNDLKRSNPSLSPQNYRPRLDAILSTRFKKIGIGYGTKMIPGNKEVLNNPGPGAYDIHSVFEEKFRKKIPIN